jgi:hypothetical protein
MTYEQYFRHEEVCTRCTTPLQKPFVYLCIPASRYVVQCRQPHCKMGALLETREGAGGDYAAGGGGGGFSGLGGGSFGGLGSSMCQLLAVIVARRRAYPLEPSPLAKQTHADASDEASVSNEAATANAARVINDHIEGVQRASR